MKLDRVSPLRFEYAYALAYGTMEGVKRESLTAPAEIETTLVNSVFYLSLDSRQGYAVVDGDLRYVFSLDPGKGHEIVDHAVSVGGAEKLDCFDGYLVDFYRDHGFTEYAREKNWTEGGPDVVFMDRFYRCAHCGIKYGH